MKKRKNIFIACVMMITLFTFLFSSAEVSAAKIIIITNPNPGGVHVLSLNEINYSIEVDEETEIGYVVYSINGMDEILGTCNVMITDITNNNTYNLCVSDDNELGSIVITVDRNSQIITETSGEVSDIFSFGSLVNIVE